jgi:uracil-DNA glycosylase
MVDHPRNLAHLLADIRRCRICRDRPAGAPLPHEPRPVLQASATARILIAGQAPGVRVHRSGKPFTDPSGVRLRGWLGIGPEIFYDESRIAVVPMGFCFPGLTEKGTDLPPRPECARAWRQQLMAALPQVELIIAVGLHAQRWHLGEDWRGSLTDTVTSWRKCLKRSPPAIPLPHPSWRNNAWLEANPWFEADLLGVLRLRVSRLL